MLFDRAQTEREDLPTPLEGRSFDTSQAAGLSRHATLEEVRKTVFGMKRLGSPGPDGIQAIFYQRFWDVVGETITRFVNEALRTSKIPVGMLEAFITLIPKNERPKSASDFRPITLLNVIFKVVSKVLVNRLRPLMKKFIGPFQNSFLPGRSTMDNIVLAQEVMHGLRHKKGKKGFMMIKLDLHKAYDSLDWGFLESVLRKVGFPECIIDLILFSLRESSISILWNGERLPPLGVSRGLRQGDPLAPYLFILAMEVLLWEIQDEVQRGRWKPVKITRGGMELSHLFFADYLILFGEATEDQTRTILACVERFSRRSGLTINFSKSLIYCSPNTCHRVRRRIGETAGIPVSENMGRYLGIPILQERVSKKTFDYILDSMKKKLAGWKANSLSFAGHRILTQSALATIPVYTMQAMAIPRGTCEEIDRTCRNFLWGDNQESKKMHLVRWEEVCKPREFGGLGLRQARDFNDALLAKLAWQMHTMPDKLWVKAMRSKYVKQGDFATAQVPVNASWEWKSIVRGREIIEANVGWRVGNGRSINFWTDRWIGDRSLCQEESIAIPGDIATLKVSDFILHSRSWDVAKLQDVLPEEIVNAIRAIPIPIREDTVDTLIWPKNTQGTFTVRSAYDAIAVTKQMTRSGRGSGS